MNKEELIKRLKLIGFEEDKEHNCFIDNYGYEITILTDFEDY